MKLVDSSQTPLKDGAAIHVIGAGGAGMNAIGAVLVAMGHPVSGSDLRDSTGVNRLRSLGARIEIGHNAANLGNCEIVCRSTAVPDDNVEVVAALQSGRPVLTRAQILAQICEKKRTVAIAGTHGKTTTSSMLALALMGSDLHPSFIVGGDLNEIGSGAVWDREGELFVVEADESDGTFLELAAEAAVVTNIEADHLDYFGSFEALVAAFEVFVSSTKGPRVLCADDEYSASVAKTAGDCVTYGTSENAHYRIVNVENYRYSSKFRVQKRGIDLGECHLPVPGIHNVRNACAALSIAVELGAEPQAVISALGRFAGVARRFEFRGEQNGVVYVDDYAHLPTEVSSVLEAVKAGEWRRVIAIFQPHRYSRTAELWRDFEHSFVDADHLVLTGVYPAGEPARPGVTGELLLRAVLDAHPYASVTYLPGREQVSDYLSSILRPGDLCLTMGAGDLTSVADEVQQLRRPLPT